MTGNISASSVLVIEPDKLLAQTYQQALRGQSVSSEWHSTAQGAITSIDKARPQVILLEVQLPGHNGIEFLHELRSYPDWQSIPVIIFTLVPEHELGLNQEIRQQLNIMEYCYKPHTSLTQLLKIVGGYLS